MLPAYQQLPTAVIAAREDEALTHGQVMYGLIKPTKDMSQVESTAAQVNVIPKKRIYRMEDPDDIDLFMAELMKRPLVLQPSAYIGRGFAVLSCAFYTKEERWVMLINQAHPKVRSRIQMGIETAKAKISKGEPFILEISFNAYLKRVYLDRLTKAVLDNRFTFIDFEDAEIVIRYPGDRYHRGMQWEIKASNKIRFEFEDLLPSDITRRTVTSAQSEWKDPSLRVIMPDELKTFLPNWCFENIDPLEGVEIPEDAEDDLEGGATSGIKLPPHEVLPSVPPMPEGKVVGRARRKAAQAGDNIAVSVELHVLESNGPQALYPPLGHVNRSPDHSYEKLDRNRDMHENPYSIGPHSIRTNRPPDLPYENIDSNGPYGQRISPHGPAQVPPRTPHTPDGSQEKPSIAHSPASPHTPTSAYTPINSHTPTSPCTRTSPGIPQYTQGQRSYSPMYQQHNSEQVTTWSAQQTYFTDEDDVGFNRRSQKSSQQHTSNMYNANYKKPGYDRYKDQISNSQSYDPRDRYADKPVNRRDPRAARPDDLYRGSLQQNLFKPDGPVPAPRGFHRHHGSGRSDTSASDSGFGETDTGIESSLHRIDRYCGRGTGEKNYAVKTPYYNRGFDQDSPEQESSVVDVLAKHKAMAAKLLQQQGQSVPNPHHNIQTHAYHISDPNYKRIQNSESMEESFI